MSTLNRKKLLEEANYYGQRMGTLNVLMTNARSQQIGLSATEFECYSILLMQGSMTAGNLAKLCGITTGGLTSLVDRLEKLGFVERLADPADRRRVLVHAKITTELKAKLRMLYQPLADAFNKLNEDLSDQELAFIIDHYKKVSTLMERSIAEVAGKKK